jgi:hypothetical protein
MTIAERQFPLYESVILMSRCPLTVFPSFSTKTRVQGLVPGTAGPVAPPQPELLREPERF